MRHGSLFSGIGGFDLAAEWMGWENIFHCEWNPFGRRVLHHYWPNAISYEDVTNIDFRCHRGSIDILTGGFPCQPYSSAGKRKGKEDERHLWPEMLRAIREIKPRWVVGENVRGLVNWNGGLVFDEVQLELEAEGYEVQPFLLPAAGVNAPHRRDRVWFVGYKKKLDGNTESNGNTTFGEVSAKKPRHTESADSLGVRGTVQGVVAHSNGSNDRREPGEDESKSGEKRVQERHEVRQSIEPSKVRDASNSNGIRLQQRENSAKMGGGQSEVQREGNQPTNAIKTNGEIANASNSDSRRLERSAEEGWNGINVEREGEFRNASNSGSKRLERIKNKGENRGKEDTREANRRGHSSRKVRSVWEEFPTQSPICDGDDGLSSRLDGITFPKWRNESIKAYGNAIVPQVAIEIFKIIEAI